MSSNIENKQVFTLSDVARSVQKTISTRYARTYWIKAEMNKLNHYSYSGHAYPELVEKREGKIVAEMRGTLWRSTYERINAEFIKYLDEPLKDGITLVFEASITYHPMYGVGLNIVDIDVNYVLGKLEKEKKESIAKLKKEGFFYKNKQLDFPLLPKRIAVISVETSKGLSDFYKIIQNNPWQYQIECTLFPSLLQGDNSIPAIINQLNNIRGSIEEFDVVTIIRGGGGEVGLSSYNNYQLSKSIAEFPIPILTGIGHATNETVSEMVAYRNAITPSNLAEFILQYFHGFSNALQIAEQKIAYQVEKQFLAEKQKLSHNLHTILWKGNSLIEKTRQTIQYNKQQIHAGSQRILHKEKQLLNQNKTIIRLADPIQILNKGFALIWHDGVIITNIDALKEGDVIMNQLKDGELYSKIVKK